MMLITKELCLAVVKSHSYAGGNGICSDIETCSHCGAEREYAEIELKHESTCIVVRAKLFLKHEWGIEA